MTPSPKAMSSAALFERLKERRPSDPPDFIEAMNAEYNQRCEHRDPVVDGIRSATDWASTGILIVFFVTLAWAFISAATGL